jgi:hypothetical protein
MNGIMSNGVVVAQGGSALLRPDPLSLELMPDRRGNVAIIVENVQDLYGLEVHLAFDPDVVEVVDADPTTVGVQLELAGWWKGGFVAVNRADNQYGRIDFAATLLHPALPASGKRVVAIITFAARKAGVSALSIEAAILSTQDAETIPYTQQQGEIGVRLGGQAPEVDNVGESSDSSPGMVATGQLVLAGLSILLFLAAGIVFTCTLRRKR